MRLRPHSGVRLQVVGAGGESPRLVCSLPFAFFLLHFALQTLSQDRDAKFRPSYLSCRHRVANSLDLNPPVVTDFDQKGEGVGVIEPMAQWPR